MAYEFKLPDLGEGIHEGELVKWLVKEGDTVKEHDNIAQIETDKALVEVPTPKSGTILKLHVKEGEKIKVGETLMTIGAKGEKAAKAPAKEAPKKVVAPVKKKVVGKKLAPTVIGEIEEAQDVTKHVEIKREKARSAVQAVPAARALAKELNIDLSTIKGTGPGGVITMADIKGPAGKPTVTGKPVSAPKVTFEKYGRVLKIPFKGVRKKIAENMVLSEHTAVHVTHMDEIDVTKLWDVRKEKKPIAENQGFPLTFLPFIVKSCCIGLKEQPYMNSSLDEESSAIVVKQYFNIGIAVDTTEGLMVPVVKGAEKRSIMDIAKEIYKLAEQARDRSIKLDDLQGGTFTITNIGSLGGTYATPIINYPEVAILAIGRIYDKPHIADGKISVRKVLPVSLSFDHRVVDGAYAAKFVNTIKKHLEDPNLLLLDAT